MLVVQPKLHLAFRVLQPSNLAVRGRFLLQPVRSLFQVGVHPQRIVPPNLHQVPRVEGVLDVLIVPHGAVGDALEGIVDGEHDRIRANLRERADKRWGGEVTGSGDEDLGAEIVTHELVLGHAHLWEPCAVELVIDTIQVVGANSPSAVVELDAYAQNHVHVLAHVPEHQLDPWMAIQNSTRDDAQHVHVDPIGIPQRRELQLWPSLPHLLVDQLGRAPGMDVNRRVALLRGRPEHIVLRLVVEEHHVPVLTGTLKIVQHHAHKPLLLAHAPAQLSCRLLRIVHAQRDHASEAARRLEDFLLKPVVGKGGQPLRRGRVSHTLCARREKREDHQVHAILVHLLEALRMDILKVGDQVPANDTLGGEGQRIVGLESLRNGPAFFKGDLAEHCEA